MSQESNEQADQHPKNTFRISTGLGFEDGLISLTWMPTLGITYERALSKRFAASLQLYSYFRTQPDGNFSDDLNGSPVLDIIANGAYGPFLTAEDLEHIAETGIKQLSPQKTIKFLSVPMHIGLTFFPICSEKHRLGYNVGFGVTYEASNWYRNVYPIREMILEDGTVYTNLYITLNTEFRNFSPGFSHHLFYEYSFQRFGLGGRIGSFNVDILNLAGFLPANFSVWESSVYMAFKF